MLPFGREQFLDVFAQYNAAIWPGQAVAVALGAAMVVAVWRRWRVSGRVVYAGLALMWAWSGIAYHALHFAAINRAALGFAVLFVAQAALFAHAARVDAGRTFVLTGARACFGWALVAYAALLYPLIGLAAGHAYPRMPVFGVTPCPVALFTFGLLLLSAQPVPRHLLVLPAAWALIGGSAAFLLGVPQDWPLLIGGGAAAAVLWRRASERASTAVA